MLKKYYWILCLLLTQCVSEFDPKIETNVPKVVVDGLITNQPGPYSVRLQYSYPYTNKADPRNIAGATIEISDDKGIKETLLDKGNGLYETSPTGIRGIVGRKYTVSIRTPNGKKYVSKPELLKPVAALGNVYSEFQPTATPQALSGNFNVFLDVKDPVTTGDYYRWKWSHYETIKYCLQSYTRNDFGIFYKQYECCEPCWKIEPCNGCIILANDRLTNGKNITKISLGVVLYTNTSPYFMLIEQQSLTEEAYQFWKAVDSQINNSGGIFDLPAATIIGNVVSDNDPEEQVLGFFGASSVVYKPQLILRNNVSIPPYLKADNFPWVTENTCYKCAESPYRTAKKPLGW